MEEELKPNVDAWIKTGYPMELHQRAYQLGIQGIIYPPAYGGTPPPDFDAFYELIMVDEMSRVGGGRWSELKTPNINMTSCCSVCAGAECHQLHGAAAHTAFRFRLFERAGVQGRYNR